MEARYCENEDCNVLVFEVKPVPKKVNGPEQNCPGCGQFGRKKGKQ